MGAFAGSAAGLLVDGCVRAAAVLLGANWRPSGQPHPFGVDISRVARARSSVPRQGLRLKALRLVDIDANEELFVDALSDIELRYAPLGACTPAAYAHEHHSQKKHCRIATPV